jgi:beta-1,4-mannosyl-glycoprotein beta-1,4-N-acetylglucosaminyltransferase
MAIYDCFQYFNEDHMADLRFNILNDHVDFFVISESTKTHQGDNKDLNFKIENFKKYKHKIIYTVADFQKEKDFLNHKGGESLIEQHQRNNILKGLDKANDNDLIILSDSDEIPDLTKLNEINNNKKFIAFSQKMFMYKINLQNIDESDWIGSKITKKKNITTMQNLRNLKFKKYPFWRIDKKNLQTIHGGWHFSFLQTSEQILKKIKSFSHGEFNIDNINEKSIEKKILKNEDIFGRGITLKKIELDSSYPNYILENKEKFSKWII